MMARSRAAAAAAGLSALAATASPVTVTPSGDAVPENLLRIELHLRRPLSRPLAMAHVRLLDERGATIPDALLDLPLPGADGRTISLLLDPARVKTGVGANVALGRALHAGEEVTLVVDDPQLSAPLRKRWHVGAPFERGLLPGEWRFASPRAGSRDTLDVGVASPLTASSARLIAVRGPDGERLAGDVSLRAGETLWTLRPARRWAAGHYALVVHPRLEDVAGNRPCAPFEARGLGGVECSTEEHAFDVR
jgi:hypothetical protein